MEIFKTLNSRTFYIYWCIGLKLEKIFQNGVIYIALKFYPKNRQLRFLMMSLQIMKEELVAVAIDSGSSSNRQ